MAVRCSNVNAVVLLLEYGSALLPPLRDSEGRTAEEVARQMAEHAQSLPLLHILKNFAWLGSRG